LVFSTLHTNAATGIITRLADMGISPILMGDPNLLVCLICQRLVPILCPECKIDVADAPAHKAVLPRWQAVFGKKAQGLKARHMGSYCQACNGLGIKGRTVVAEIIWIDEAGREFIQQRDTLGWEKYLKDNGWRNYHERALELMFQGIIDPLDVERLIGPIDNLFREVRFNYKQAAG
jgi:type II secretory ATPase GspE/PulE/Tfp pilus assembly ATPase PilB-like protein